MHNIQIVQIQQILSERLSFQLLLEKLEMCQYNVYYAYNVYNVYNIYNACNVCNVHNVYNVYNVQIQGLRINALINESLI